MSRILIVDDEQNILELAKLYLEREGHQVEGANNGQEAVAKHGTFNPELIILDLMLPDIDGFEICRQIRARSDVPILMLTARKEDIIRLLSDKTEFEKRVLVETFKIPKGKVSTYGRIAARLGKPRAYRATANALHKNPLFPVVPCHRVVKSDGGFGGEKKGAESRRMTLAAEGVLIENGKVRMSRDILF